MMVAELSSEHAAAAAQQRTDQSVSAMAQML